MVIDLCSCQVVGWSPREDMTRDIVIDALRMAWFKRHPSMQAGLIFPSDRDRQYASQDFRDLPTEYGFTASMSQRGNCRDNACSEALFGSLKVGRHHGQRFVTRLWGTGCRGKVTPGAACSAPEVPDRPLPGHPGWIRLRRQSRRRLRCRLAGWEGA